ncbi:aldo/keto reductase [Shigella sonnei]
MEFSVLSNNLKMPMMGFGVFRLPIKTCANSQCRMLSARVIDSIDTAAVYGNEDAIGEAVREAISEGLCTEKSYL